MFEWIPFKRRHLPAWKWGLWETNSHETSSQTRLGGILLSLQNRCHVPFGLLVPHPSPCVDIVLAPCSSKQTPSSVTFGLFCVCAWTTMHPWGLEDCAWTTMHLWALEDSVWELVFSFYLMSPRNLSQVDRLGGRHFYPMTYLSCPKVTYGSDGRPLSGTIPRTWATQPPQLWGSKVFTNYPLSGIV